MKRHFKISSVGFRCAPSVLDEEPKLTSLARIVQHYIKKYRSDAEEELDCFRRTDSLSKVVQQAGMAMDSEDNKFPHQWRIRQVALEKATDKLHEATRRIRVCGDFHSLFEVVQPTAGSVNGIGELYVYDTTLRIGAHLGLYPNRVYLHAGTRVGAKALGLDVRRTSIPVNELPREFRQLEAREIEDVLCIYKNRFKRAAGG